jgi:hypothetical protein
VEKSERKPSKHRQASDDRVEQEQPPSKNKGRDGMMEGLKGVFGF